MNKQEYLTIPQMAKILGISRIAVYRKVKKGQIKARKIGRNYAIPFRVEPFSEKEGRRLDAVIGKVLKEYGETFRLLGRE